MIASYDKNCINSNVIVKGDIECNESMEYDGKLDGDLIVEKDLYIYENAYIKGNVKANFLVVYGKIKGTVLAKNLIIKPTASIYGDIVAKNIVIEDGAKIKGNIIRVS